MDYPHRAYRMATLKVFRNGEPIEYNLGMYHQRMLTELMNYLTQFIGGLDHELALNNMTEGAVKMHLGNDDMHITDLHEQQIARLLHRIRNEAVKEGYDALDR